MSKKLRFAPLIRVSTECQGKKGESLLSQKSRIESNVKILNGTIPVHAWKYRGQEHSSEGYERKLFDQMINDCSKGLFDAIMVDDASRWARDVVKSKTTLDVLRKNGIKLFVGPMEIDLFSPDPMFIFDMQIQVAEYYAQTRSYKATLNKIHRAKRGLPTSGRLPFGRTYDKKAEKWGVDEKKKKLLKRVATEYLKGGSLKELIKKYDLGLNSSNLLKTLKYRSGDTWSIHFKVEKFNIDETVNIEVPRLLPEKQIKAIRERSEANKTYTHGQYKNKYLFSRFVVCGHCGSSLTAQTNNGSIKYYKHKGTSGEKCTAFNGIRADMIEVPIMSDIFQMAGDEGSREQAMREATVNEKHILNLKKNIAELEKDIKKIQKQKSRLIDAISEGIIEKSDVKEKMDVLREKESLIQNDLQMTESKLGSLPSEEQIKNRAKVISLFRKKKGGPTKDDMKKLIEHSYLGSEEHLNEMTFDEKREVLQSIFPGKDDQGKRYGVYLKRNESGWKYNVKGLLPSVIGTLDNDYNLIPFSQNKRVGPCSGVRGWKVHKEAIPPAKNRVMSLFS